MTWTELDWDALERAVTPRTRLVMVCDPNNPTGTRVERSAFLGFAGALPPGVLLVIDQAYREYMDSGATDGVDVLKSRPETLVLRTASKIYGLAAVRFGYGYASPAVIESMNRVRLPFNVARPSAAAMLAALDDDEFVARSIENNELGKRYLFTEFARLGVHVYPSSANFLAVGVPVTADEAYIALLRRGVIVRSGDGLGLPRYLRVTVGTPAENQAFVAAFEAAGDPGRHADRDRVGGQRRPGRHRPADRMHRHQSRRTARSAPVAGAPAGLVP